MNSDDYICSRRLEYQVDDVNEVIETFENVMYEDSIEVLIGIL